MRVFPSASGLATAIGMAVLLSGCSGYQSTTTALNRGTSSAFAGIAGVGERVGAPWGGMRPTSPGDSLTVQRVVSGGVAAEPLLPEPGNVWPEREPPRTTLMNPDQALRGIPGYSPITGERGGVVQPPQPVTPQPEQPPPPRPQRRGAGGPFVPPPTAAMPEVPPQPRTQSQLPPLPPLPDRASGSDTVPTPQGVLVPSTRSGNVETFNQPGGGFGTITRDGNTVIINRPGEPPQILPAPR